MTHCDRCGDRLFKEELFSEIIVTPKPKVDVQRCVDAHFTSEMIQNYSCLACNRQSKALRVTTIEKAPEILTCIVNQWSLKGDKIEVQLSVNNKITLRTGTTEYTYKYMSSVHHKGGKATSGHYTAVCSKPARGTLICYDDAKIHHFTTPGSGSYILFYRREVKIVIKYFVRLQDTGTCRKFQYFVEIVFSNYRYRYQLFLTQQSQREDFNFSKFLRLPLPCQDSRESHLAQVCKGIITTGNYNS